MPEKKKDILDEILGATANQPQEHFDAPCELQGLESLIYRSYRPEPSQAPEYIDLDPLTETVETRLPRRRATHYLSEDVYAELGLVKDKIADLFTEEHKHKITRSDVVNQALRIVLEEFETKGLESPLVNKVLRAVKKKAKQLKDSKHAPATRVETKPKRPPTLLQDEDL